MTYFQILALFILPPILVFTAVIRKQISPMAWRLLGILVVVAVFYTTPWDNYLVANQIWWYDPNLVTGVTLGWVPIEEYTFFVLQTLFTGLFFFWIKQQQNKNNGTAHRQRRLGIQMTTLAITGLVWALAVGLLFWGTAEWRYLSITVAWAFIPVMVQIAFGADLLLKGWRLVLPAILIPTFYLSMVDWLAIGFGTWTISPAYTTGLLFAGRLPLEEVVFFLLTNVLVVFGLYLGLEPASLERIPNLWKEKILG